jgi:hypothetical protein
VTKIYYTVSDGGDGSASAHFFECQECIDLLEEHDPDTWASGEGGGFFTCDNFSQYITPLEEVKSRIASEVAEWAEMDEVNERLRQEFFDKEEW